MHPTSPRPTRVPVLILALTMLAAFGIALPRTAAAQSPIPEWDYVCANVEPGTGLPCFNAHGTLSPLEGGGWNGEILLLAFFSETTPGYVDQFFIRWADGATRTVADPFAGMLLTTGDVGNPFHVVGIPHTTAIPVRPESFDITWRTQAGATGVVTVQQYIPPGDIHLTPEPSTYALMATGLLGMGVIARRRRHA